jgi:hypothetical protein
LATAAMWPPTPAGLSLVADNSPSHVLTTGGSSVGRHAALEATPSATSTTRDPNHPTDCRITCRRLRSDGRARDPDAPDPSKCVGPAKRAVQPVAKQ